jgi:hypothetical protein
MSTGKGVKRTKNQPVFYNEPKKEHSLMLTDTVWNILKENAKLNKMSVSEYVEQVSRGLKAPPSPTSTA